MSKSFSRTAAIGAAILVWSTAASSAPRGGHGGGGHGGGGHAAAHGGSVHFAARPAPVRAPGPAHVGAVRAEHYAREDHRGIDGRPYRAEYERHFRPGYQSLQIGGVPYYYYDALPPGCIPQIVNGITDYVLDGVYYQPYVYGGRTVYLIVPA